MATREVKENTNAHTLRVHKERYIKWSQSEAGQASIEMATKLLTLNWRGRFLRRTKTLCNFWQRLNDITGAGKRVEAFFYYVNPETFLTKTYNEAAFFAYALTVMDEDKEFFDLRDRYEKNWRGKKFESLVQGI